MKKKVKEIGVFSLAISNATLAELYFGAYNSQKVDAIIHAKKPQMNAKTMLP